MNTGRTVESVRDEGCEWTEGQPLLKFISCEGGGGSIRISGRLGSEKELWEELEKRRMGYLCLDFLKVGYCYRCLNAEVSVGLRRRRGGGV